MATKYRNTYENGDYVMGTAARKLEAPVRPLEKQEKRHTVTARKNQEKALPMDLPYVLMLTLAAVCTLYLCINYLQLQSAVAARLNRIEALEKSIETLKSDNDALETRINTSVDLDYVYKVATEELGMVYANKDQVRLYKRTESEYVRQYEDIPER